MFDWVDVGGPDPIPCPECGTDLEGWQTKSTGCTLTTVPWYTTHNFYTSCSCGAWIEYRQDEEYRKERFDGFTVKVKKKS